MYCPRCGSKQKVYCIAVQEQPTNRYHCISCKLDFEVFPKLKLVKKEDNIEDRLKYMLGS